MHEPFQWIIHSHDFHDIQKRHWRINTLWYWTVMGTVGCLIAVWCPWLVFYCEVDLLLFESRYLHLVDWELADWLVVTSSDVSLLCNVVVTFETDDGVCALALLEYVLQRLAWDPWIVFVYELGLRQVRVIVTPKLEFRFDSIVAIYNMDELLVV